jgi:hypothetical protein
VVQAHEPFIVETSGQNPRLPAVGLSGARSVIRGESMVEENHIKNPTPSIGRSIARDLASEFGLSLAVFEEVYRSTGENVEWPSDRPPRADLVLNVATSV